MTNPLGFFTWYRAAQSPRVEEIDGGPTIIGKAVSGRYLRAKRAEAYQPFARFDSLFGQFASIEDEAGAVSFVSRFGAVTEAGFSAGDALDTILEQASLMARVLHGKNNALARAGVKNISLRAEIIPDPDTGGLTVQLKPADLLHGMWLQLGYAMTGQGTVRSCKHCGVWFTAGGQGKRRADAAFCSPEHKAKYFSLRRSAS